MLWCEWGIIRHLVRPGVHLHHIPLNACLYVEMAFFIIVFFFGHIHHLIFYLVLERTH